eukprot:2803640-Prymnesium_polylepis.1
MGWSGAPIPPLKVAQASAWSRRALTWRARISIPLGSQRHVIEFCSKRRTASNLLRCLMRIWSRGRVGPWRGHVTLHLSNYLRK